MTMNAILAKMEKEAQEAEVAAEGHFWRVDHALSSERVQALATAAIAAELRATRKRTAFNRAYDRSRS